MVASRAHLISSFTIIKGALISETYNAFRVWDLGRSSEENLKQLKATNSIGASSNNWLRDIAKVLHRRFDPSGRDKTLVSLAQAGCDLEIWKPILLWHMTRDEFLVRNFLLRWLFPAFTEGAYRLLTSEVACYLKTIPKKIVGRRAGWSENTEKRLSIALLRMAADFGLLQGGGVKEFASYRLPDASFLYLLHAITATEKNAQRVVNSPEWGMYLMSSADVEHELLRLHQFRTVEYEVAGSLAQLKLPCTSPDEYAKRLVA